jgi:hypothetical protein
MVPGEVPIRLDDRPQRRLRIGCCLTRRFESRLQLVNTVPQQGE